MILAVGTFVLGVDGFVLSGLLPQVSAGLHVSVSTAGQLTTLFALVYAVGSPVIAALTGSWDRRSLLATGMAVFMVGTVLQATGPNFLAVACGRVIAAVGAAAYQANAYSTAGLRSSDTHRARSLAVVAGGSSLALVAGLPFGILVGQFWGWRNALWVLVVLAALSGIALGLLPAVHAPRTGLRDRVRALSDSRVLGILIGTVTVLTPTFLIIAYLPTILSASGGLVVATMLAYGSGQFRGTTAVPRLIRRRPLRSGSRRERRHRLRSNAGRDTDDRGWRSRDDGRARPKHIDGDRTPAAPLVRAGTGNGSGRDGSQRIGDLHRKRARRSARRRRPGLRRGNGAPACRGDRRSARDHHCQRRSPRAPRTAHHSTAVRRQRSLTVDTSSLHLGYRWNVEPVRFLFG